MKRYFFTFNLDVLLLFQQNVFGHNQATQLICGMEKAIGGLEKYQKLKDVSYTYSYSDLTNEFTPLNN